MRFLKPLLLAAALALLPFAAKAQVNGPTSGVLVVSSCGSQSLTSGQPSTPTVDTTGKLCTNANSSGSTTITSPLGPSTAATSAVAITDTGTPITGQSIGAGGQGLIGWLSQIYSAATAAIPTQSSTVPIGGTSLCDGANGTTNPCTTAATVLAGSTGAAAANKALVVSPFSYNDPCNGGAKSSYALSSNATTLTQIIAASGSTKIYICSIAVISAGATAFNLNTGTGSNCASSTAVVIGSTTAANGLSFAANGGLTLGNGGSTVAFANLAGAEICILQSNAVYSSGVITYVQQ